MLASSKSKDSMLANRRLLDLKLLGRQGIDKLTVESRIPPIVSRANYGVHLIVGACGHFGSAFAHSFRWP